jgi:hypothetical protein
VDASTLDGACEAVFATTNWRRIACALCGLEGIGVQHGEVPDDPRWPNEVDLALEPDGAIYVVCHGARGRDFLEALVGELRRKHAVAVEEI